MRCAVVLLLSGCFAQLGHSEGEFLCVEECAVTLSLEATGGALTSTHAVTIVRSDSIERCAIGLETTSRKSCPLSVDPGTAVQFLAGPMFTEWSGVCRGRELECTISIVEPAEVIARFCGDCR
jgi:hypothetical protein